MAEKEPDNRRIVAQNRKARFNYHIGETFEAGIALSGSEVKSLRSGKATIAESYADARAGEIWLMDAFDRLRRRERVLAYEYEGHRFDCGRPIGLLKASLYLALRRDDMRPELEAYLRSLAAG